MKMRMKGSSIDLNRILDTVVSVLPAIPLVMRRRRQVVSAPLIGGIGLAVIGGIALMMLLSPRTRHRAISAAKGTVGKVNEKVHGFREHNPNEPPMSNGLGGSDYSTSSGL